MVQIFNLPKTHDEFFTIQFLLFFLIGFMLNAFANGQATLVFIHNEYDISPNSPVYNLTEQYRIIQEYSHSTLLKDNRIWYLILIFYWIVSPLINFYYAIFVFYKGQFLKENINNI